MDTDVASQHRSIPTRCGRMLRANDAYARIQVLTRHKLTTQNVAGEQLVEGDAVLLVEGQEAALLPPPERTADGELGYLLGLLVGDGTFSSTKATLCVWIDQTPNSPGNAHSDPTVAMRQRAEAALRTLPHRGDFQGWFSIPHATTNEMRMSTQSLRTMAASYGIHHGHKTITDEVMQASPSFQSAFMAGLFDADGTVIGNHTKGVSVRLAQSDLELLRRVQAMLEGFGINSTIYANRRPAGERLLPDGKGGQAIYMCQADHELVVSGANLARFQLCVGFTEQDKADKLAAMLAGYTRSLNRERWIAYIV